MIVAKNAIQVSSASSGRSQLIKAESKSNGVDEKPGKIAFSSNRISPTSQSARATRVATAVTVQHLSRSQSRSATNRQLNDQSQSPSDIEDTLRDASNDNSASFTASHHTLIVSDLDQPSTPSQQSLSSSLSSIRILASPVDLNSIHPSVLSRRSSKIGEKSTLTSTTKFDGLDQLAIDQNQEKDRDKLSPIVHKDEKRRYRFRRRCCASLCPCCSPCCCLLTGLLAALLLALLVTLIALLISSKTTTSEHLLY